MNTPILNIESVGCQLIDTGYINTYYIPSLTYNIQKWFTNKEETVYIPILFNNEDKIKTIFTYYNDIYFRVQLCKYSRSHYSDEYHISELLNFEKIVNKEDKKVDWLVEAIDIKFIIKYNNYNIHIIFFPWDGFDAIPTADRFNIFKNINNTNILKSIKQYSRQFPQINCYSVYYGKSSYGTVLSKNFDTIQCAMNFIDDLNTKDEKLDSLYTKKSFKLVEN